MTEVKYPPGIIRENLLASGVSEAVVEEFIAALDPTFVADVFHMVWDTCQQVARYIRRADIPTQWHDVYHCMVTLGQAELFDAPSTGKRSVVHGNISEHPLYSTVAYQAVWLAEDYRFFYVNLQFLAVCATITARKGNVDVSDHAIVNTCLLTRQLTQQRYLDLLIDLSSIFCQFEPDHDNELAPVLQRFNALNGYLEANKKQSHYGFKLHDLHTVIAICVGDRELSQRRERVGAVKGVAFREVFGELESEKLTLITGSSVDEETEYQSQVVDGGAPNEVKSPRVQIKASLPQNMPKAWTSSRQIAYRQKGMLNAITQRNQRLLYDTSRLLRGELVTILTGCDKELLCLEESTGNGCITDLVEALDTQLAILLLLLTGLSLEQLPATTMVKENNTKQLHIMPIDNGKGVAISFVPPKHNLARIKPARFQAIVHQPSDHIALRVGDAFYPLLKRAFHLKRLSGLRLNMPLILTDLETLEVNIKQQFKRWNKSVNGHITIPRLMSWLDDAIYELTGDLAACFYTANNRGSKPAQAYYANYEHERLLSIYKQATSRSFILKGQTQQVDIDVEPATTGSRLATIQNTLPLLVDCLMENVGKANSHRFDKKIELHNRLVSYIYMMFAFGIGLRSVNDPLESVNNVDLSSGVILLNDKENRSVTNCRYVFLPVILREQLIAYKKHLSTLATAVNACSLTLRDQIAASISGENNAPMLFFINCDRKRFERVTPKRLTGWLRGVWPVPLNSGRHYLRSELVRRGCPACWIDAMMGHAEIGVEANSKFSAMSFGTLKRLTTEHLEPLVKQGGWRVLKGLCC